MRDVTVREERKNFCEETRTPRIYSEHFRNLNRGLISKTNISDVWPIDRTVRVRIESGSIRNSSMERYASYNARKYVKLHLRIPFDPIRAEPPSISACQPFLLRVRKFASRKAKWMYALTRSLLF